MGTVVHWLGKAIVEQAPAEKGMAEEMSAILAEMTNFAREHLPFLWRLLAKQLGKGIQVAFGRRRRASCRRGFRRFGSAEGANQPFPNHTPAIHHAICLRNRSTLAMRTDKYLASFRHEPALPTASDPGEWVSSTIVGASRSCEPLQPKRQVLFYTSAVGVA